MNFNINLLIAFLDNNKLSKTKFCKMARINYKTLIKFLNNNMGIRIKAIFKIAKALNVEVYMLFVD